MDNPKSIAPLMTKLVELKRLHTTKHPQTLKFIVCNQFTAQQLVKEAQTVGKLSGKSSEILIDGLVLVTHPQDASQELVMEVA